MNLSLASHFTVRELGRNNPLFQHYFKDLTDSFDESISYFDIFTILFRKQILKREILNCPREKFRGLDDFSKFIFEFQSTLGSGPLDNISIVNPLSNQIPIIVCLILLLSSKNLQCIRCIVIDFDSLKILEKNSRACLGFILHILSESSLSKLILINPSPSIIKQLSESLKNLEILHISHSYSNTEYPSLFLDKNESLTNFFSLKEVNFHKVRLLPEVLSRILSNNKDSLINLYLDNCKLFFPVTRFEYLKQCSKLKKLTLKNTWISTSGFEDILDHINIEIEELTLDLCKINQINERSLTMSCPALSLLSLRSNEISQEGYEAILRSLLYGMKCLKHLNLSTNNIKKLRGDLILAGLLAGSSLEELNVSSNELEGLPETIFEVDLDPILHCNAPVSLKRLILDKEFWKRKFSLREYFARLTKTKPPPLISILKVESDVLKEFVDSGIPIDFFDFNALAYSLSGNLLQIAKNYEGNPNFKLRVPFLCLPINSGLHKILCFFGLENLSSLKLFASEPEDNIIQLSLLNLETSGINLKTLEIYGSKIGNSAFEYLLNSLADNIEKLILVNCGITKVNAKLLRTCERLTWLDLSENLIENEGFENILEALHDRIEYLSVVNCRIRMVNFDLLKKCTKIPICSILLDSTREFQRYSPKELLLYSQAPFEALSKLDMNFNFPELLGRLHSKSEIVNLGQSFNSEQLRFLLGNMNHVIRKLTLSHPLLQELPLDVFKNMFFLKALNLNNCSIKDSGLADILTLLKYRLEELSVQSCGLEFIPFGLLSDCLYLRKLDFSRNEIRHTIKIEDFLAASPSLMHLELTYAHGTRTSFIGTISPSISGLSSNYQNRLSHINLSKNSLGSKEFYQILDQFYQSLESLILKDCGITEVREELLTQCLNLTVLDLSDNSIGKLGVLHVLNAIKTIQLQELNIRGWYVNENNHNGESKYLLAQELTILLECKSLKYLDLDFNWHISQSLELLFFIFKYKFNLIEFPVNDAKYIIENSFKALYLRSSPIKNGPRILDLVAEEGIEELYLINCQLTSEDFPEEKLKLCRKLKRLNLSNNIIGNIGYGRILSCLHDSLEFLFIEKGEINEFQTDLLKKCPSMYQNLYVPFVWSKPEIIIPLMMDFENQIDWIKCFPEPNFPHTKIEFSDSHEISQETLDIVLSHLAPGLQIFSLTKLPNNMNYEIPVQSFTLCKNLTSLYLFGFKLGNEGFEVILDSLYISLQSLTLSQSSISKVRSDSLSRCQFLIYLNLSENDIENDQYEMILKALKAQIEALILEDCKITKVMPDLVIQCKRLRSLSFGTCSGISLTNLSGTHLFRLSQ